MKIARTATPSHRSYQPSLEQLKDEVQDLTERTDRYRDQFTGCLALTTTAGLAAAAGGALSLLSVTQNVGMTVAGLGGMALAAGIGLCLHSNRQYSQSEAERLAVAGELFDARKAHKRERIRELFT